MCGSTCRLLRGHSGRTTACFFSAGSSSGTGGGEEVEVKTRGSVRVIGLNRPQASNAVNQHTAAQLFHAFKEFDQDTNVNAAVLHGVGKNFCAGYDLKELASSEGHLQPCEKVDENPAPMVSIENVIFIGPVYQYAGSNTYDIIKACSGSYKWVCSGWRVGVGTVL